MKRTFLLIAAFVAVIHFTSQGQEISISSSALQVNWQHEADGWHISAIKAGGKTLPHPSGQFTLLYLNRHPAANMVDMDLEGRDFSFYPSEAKKLNDGTIEFNQHLLFGDMVSRWKIDPQYPTDIHVEMEVKAKSKGYYAIASPTLATIDKSELKWGMIPGNWYGREVETDFQLSTHYSMGVPAIPYLAKERNTMTLCPLITTKNGLSLAVIPDPGTATDPWRSDSSTRGENRLGMSLVNRHAQLSPTAYAPVLGQTGSDLKPGDVAKFNFRYSVQAADWFPVFRHAVDDVYKFPSLLQVQQNKRSLSERVRLMQVYLRDAKKSNWSVWKANGYSVGANGSKNADVGAIWMIANAGNDSVWKNRLPYIRNYKLATQETGEGFFKGAAMGEYANEYGIIEAERGNYVEPLFTTYYTLMDMGNMLLYNPGDKGLRDRVRLAADKLISWQHSDGGWDVAYDRDSHALTFPDLKDLRPTWYGLLIAYRLLGDQKYLEAAKKGANWLIHEGVDKGYFLGVCGDARNIWDFATAQCAEAYLELYNATKDEAYKKAFIATTQMYSTSIFTQPIATNVTKYVNGKERKDWEINQVGLSVEHIRGTAGGGPILISSFAGMFVRMFEMTRDSMFLYMARGAARGRDAYVDGDNGQSIYYWNGFPTVQKSTKLFPHHALWQIGWITDYLMSEMHLRSGGKVSFPGGFITPKVGPHVSYGFAPGTIFNHQANLVMPAGLLTSTNADFEYLAALSTTENKLYVMVLNQGTKQEQASIHVDLDKLFPGQGRRLTGAAPLQGKLVDTGKGKANLDVQLPAWGMGVYLVDLSAANK